MAQQARKQKRRLGKGLKSLLTTPVEIVPPAPTEISAKSAAGASDKTKIKPSSRKQQKVATGKVDLISEPEGLIYLPTELISPNPHQPRQVFDDTGLSSLANSIQKAGMMQPVVVRQREGETNYELIAGERRWRAAQIAGLDNIPALIRNLDDKTSAEWALIENLQREDLNPIDRAEAFDRLIVDFAVTQNDIAEQLGIDRSSVSNFLRLNDLETSVKDAVRDGRLSMGHAKVILGIPDASTSKAIARKCATEQWSVRELERQLKKFAPKTTPKQQIDPDPSAMHMEHLANQLGEHLGTKVNISLGKKRGSGKLSIEFFDIDQFEGLLDRLQFKPKS